jgi:hypothetical protein
MDQHIDGIALDELIPTVDFALDLRAWQDRVWVPKQ